MGGFCDRSLALFELGIELDSFCYSALQGLVSSAWVIFDIVPTGARVFFNGHGSPLLCRFSRVNGPDVLHNVLGNITDNVAYIHFILIIATCDDGLLVFIF